MHPILYEINTRCWLRELSDRSGCQVTLADVPDSAFQEWQQLGFTHIWLMGVWTSGPRSRAEALAVDDLKKAYGESVRKVSEADIAGSPYSIAKYRVPRAMGGEAGLRTFRNKLRQHGLKLLLDFVPNHLGLDHPWLRERPELFVQSLGKQPGTFAQETNDGVRWMAHGRDPNFAPWTDTAQLDYRQPATRVAMRKQLLEIAELCDGVRCDMAMLVLNDVFANTWSRFPASRFGVSASGGPVTDVAALAGEPSEGGTPNEFWAVAIEAIQARHPEFLFLAEVYWGLEDRLRSLGFGYTYDKELYDGLIRRDAAAVHQGLLNSPRNFPASSAHFLENHDEARIASLLSPAEHRAAALLILALPGMRFLHEGQLSGARIKVPVQLSCRSPEDEQPAIRQMYEQLLRALRNSAVGSGTADVLRPGEAWSGNPTARNIALIRWIRAGVETEFDLAVVNLAPHRSQCRVSLAVPKLADHNWDMVDLLGAERYARSGAGLEAQGLYLDLPEHGAQLFRFRIRG